MKYLIAVLLWFVTVTVSAQQFVPVLMYHQVREDQSPSAEIVGIGQFQAQLRELINRGYTTVTIDQLTQFMNGTASLPSKAVAITFDDGWKSQLFAAELLAANRQTATFYILSGAFDDPQYMSRADIKALSDRGFEIGAHSHTHFMTWVNNLDAIDQRIMNGELVQSKFTIEDVIGKPVTAFAWPFGYSREASITLAARLGFTSTAMVMDRPLNVAGGSALRISRININGRCSLRAFAEMVETGTRVNCNEQTK